MVGILHYQGFATNVLDRLIRWEETKGSSLKHGRPRVFNELALKPVRVIGRIFRDVIKKRVRNKNRGEKEQKIKVRRLWGKGGISANDTLFLK